MSSELHSLLIVADLVPNKKGAFERFLIEISQQARATGMQIGLVFAGGPVPPVAQSLQEQGAHVWVIPNWKTDTDRERPLVFIRHFLRIAAAESWDLITFNFCNELTVIAACLLNRLWGRRVPIIWLQHSEMKAASRWRRKISRMRLMTAFADGLIANTLSGHNEIRARGGGEQQTRLIHNAVSIPENSRRGWLRDALGMPYDAELVVCAGSLIHRKGYDVLFKAVAPLCRSRPALHVVILGEGSEQENLQCLAKQLGITRNVHFLGLRNDVADVIADCNVFALATRNETLTLAVIEAMAVGAAVVITDVGGHRELIADRVHGRIVPADAIEPMREAIRSLLDDPKLAYRYGAAARQRATAKFELRRKVSQQLDFYREVVCSANANGTWPIHFDSELTAVQGKT